MKILLIEDNDILRDNIATYLGLKGMSCETHKMYKGASYKILTEHYNAIILDLGLGDSEKDGIDICKEIREKGNTTPLLILTARSESTQKVQGLESGADDYVTKPFDYEELIARIKSLTQREDKFKGNKYSYKNIWIDETKRLVYQDEVPIELSKLEFDLLIYLLRNHNIALTKQQIIENVWGEYDPFEESRTLDIHIGYLRKKIGKDMIQTIRGIGYMIS